MGLAHNASRNSGSMPSAVNGLGLSAMNQEKSIPPHPEGTVSSSGAAAAPCMDMRLDRSGVITSFDEGSEAWDEIALVLSGVTR